MTGYESKRAAAQDKLVMTKDEALKLALELKNSASAYWTEKEIPIIKKLIKLLAQPAQEPVAWAVIGDGKFGEYELGQVFVDYEATHHYWENRGYELVPVYTTPPQRTWVGLTEEDFSAINQSCLTKLQAATSAESILKEKNT